MRKKIKILYVSYEPPAFPGGAGGQTRQYGLLKHLSLTHEIHGIFPRRKPHEIATIRKEVFTGLYMPPPENFFVKKIFNLFMRYCHIDHPQYVRMFEGMRYSMMPLIKKELKQGRYDLLNIEHSNIAHWLSSLRISIPTVLVAHNVKTIMWKRYHQNGVGTKRKRLFNEYKKFETYEKRYLSHYRCLIAMSEVDRQYLQTICPEANRIEVVPNGVDIDYFSPDRNVRAQPHSLLFTGSMGHPPNDEAMDVFCRQIFPKILARNPGTTLTIAGRAPSHKVRKLEGHPQVSVTGYVPDIRPYFNMSEVFIVPLLSGSGTRLKILEAMAMGKAIVATSIGAEGIECNNGKDIIIADHPEQVVKEVTGLLQNSERREKMGLAARKLVEEKYSWKSLSVQLERIYLDLMKNHR